MSDHKTSVVIVGGGFAGINAAKKLAKNKSIEILLIDRRNHHLFQPLLYQVAMAGLSPCDISEPIRAMLAEYPNIRVLLGEVQGIDRKGNKVLGDFGEAPFDYLLLACGARHSYFGKNEWEEHAPGLKTLGQAVEIRRRVLLAFENAELTQEPSERKAHLTFVVVGGGPTGVELAGAIGEMSRYTLAKDFHNIDPKLSRVILIEAGPRILPSFPEILSAKATRNLEELGVQVWTSSLVTNIDNCGVNIGDERVKTSTVLWAAGVQASSLGEKLETELDRQGRIIVEPDLSVKGSPNIFVAGDQAHFAHDLERPLPGMAPVAVQMGNHVAQLILEELKGKVRFAFRYMDKGQMATIGRSRAILQSGPVQMSGFSAWLGWLVVHIYYLAGFKNRLFVTIKWAWSYLSFKRGSRLIIDSEWHLNPDSHEEPGAKDG